MYQLVEEASKVLRTPPELFDFEKDGDKAQEIADKMSEAMIKFGGIGLSANQVGLNARMFVMRTEDKGIVPFFNPELTKVSQDTDLMKEGCLSFPDIYLMIKRSTTIELKYQDVKGEEQVIMLDGLAARCVQHEIDHLNGVLFLQRASRLKLERALKARPKEQAKRIAYERRMAIARHLKKLEDEKAKKNEQSEVPSSESEERSESVGSV